VVFLVPVVVLANPGTAAAAGSWVPIYIQMDVFGSQDFVGRDCKFNARNTGTAVEVGSSGYCTGLPDASPGTLQPGEAGSSFTFTFDGADAGSASCGATYGGTLGQHPANGTVQVAGSVPAGSATITGGAADGTCTITEVCIRLMSTEYVCAEVTLPPPDTEPESPGGTCVAGNPNARWEMRSEVWSGDSTGARRIYYIQLEVLRTGNTVSTAPWGAAVFFTGANGATVALDWTMGSTYRVWESAPTKIEPTVSVRGVELWADLGPTDWNEPPPNDDKAKIYGPVQPTAPSHGYGGWTHPDLCRV